MAVAAAAASAATKTPEAQCSSTDDDVECYLDCYWMLSLRLSVQMHVVHVAAIVVAEKSMHACTIKHGERKRRNVTNCPNQTVAMSEKVCERKETHKL